jgi:hypothetical protein
MMPTPSAGAPQVALLSLNTVLHEAVPNMRALGKVREDRYWDHPGLNQLDQLAKRLAGAPIALVFTHHPVHDNDRPHPPTSASAPPPNMVMVNAPAVASKLNTTPSAVRLVFSGHTHKIWPDPGGLPHAQPAPSSHGHLKDNAVQLVAGTATQAVLPSAPVYHAQTWQIFDLSLPRTGELLVERTVLQRTRGSGPFVPLSANGQPRLVKERMVLRF